MYSNFLQQEKKVIVLIKTLKEMDVKTEDRIWRKIEKIESDVVNIKVSLATMKTKIAYISGGFSFGGALIFAIIKEFVFKT